MQVGNGKDLQLYPIRETCYRITLGFYLHAEFTLVITYEVGMGKTLQGVIVVSSRLVVTAVC